MCLDVLLPLAQPRVFRPTHIISIAPTHIPIFLLLPLSLSILVVVYREGLRGIPGPQTRNFLHFPRVKPKAYSNIYSFLPPDVVLLCTLQEAVL
jgi:hypothetical protein